MGRCLVIAALMLFTLADCVASPDNPPKNSKEPIQRGVVDYRNTTYIIDGQKIRLVDGRAVTEVVPGAASKTTTRVFGEAVYGESGEMAALILVQSTGGSGSFYYVAAARRGGDTWQGSNAVFLGDRIAPQEIHLGQGMVAVAYLDRRAEQPMTAAPTTGKIAYLALTEGGLAEVGGAGEGEQVLAGWVTIGHEVRSFVPCTNAVEHWLSGRAPAMGEITAAYRQSLTNGPVYQPLLMVLAGSFEKRPVDGFGADYPAAFRAAQLVGTLPGGHCPHALIRVESPVPNSSIASPLRIEGQALGPWFFEGDFPLLLTDGQGRTLARGYATAQGPWMTSGLVPFAGILEFSHPAEGGRGLLILQKHNPTGLPKHDDAVGMPLFFQRNP